MDVVWVVLVERDGEVFDLRVYANQESAELAEAAYWRQDVDQYVYLTKEAVYV